MHFAYYRTCKLLTIATFLLLLTEVLAGCRIGNHAKTSTVAVSNAEYDNQIRSYVARLPRIKDAISAVDPDKLRGTLRNLNGLAEDKKDALEALESIEKDSQAVLTGHKFVDELQLMNSTETFDKIFSQFNMELAEFLDERDHARTVEILRRLMDLSSSEDGATFTFEQNCSAFVLKRADAVDLQS